MRSDSVAIYHHYGNIQLKVGDGNVFVSDIVNQVRTHDRDSLNLAFLDPDGLELRWDTVAHLAKPSRMDLIIHYSQMGLNRNMIQCYESEEDTAVDVFFGDRDWRNIFKKYQDKEEHFLHRSLMDHYKEKLQGLGYKETLRDDEVGDEPLIRNANGAPLYRLLFASKHSLGRDFWQKIVRKDVYGQTRLL